MRASPVFTGAPDLPIHKPSIYRGSRATYPQAHCLRAFPADLSASPLFTRVSGQPTRKRPIDAGLRPEDLDNRAHLKGADSNSASHSKKRVVCLIAVAIAANHKSAGRVPPAHHCLFSYKATPQKFKSTTSIAPFHNPYSNPLTIG